MIRFKYIYHELEQERQPTSSKYCFICSNGNWPGFRTSGWGGMERISHTSGYASPVKPGHVFSLSAISIVCVSYQSGQGQRLINVR